MIEFKHLPTDSVVVTSVFGYRISPLDGKTKEFHNGIDVKKVEPRRDRIYAVADGVIARAYKSDSYGNCVIIDHKGWTTLSAHLDEFIVSTGDSVKAGDTIGYEGTTGHSTGVHLHFEVRNVYYSGSFWARDPALASRYTAAVDPEIYINAFLSKKVALPLSCDQILSLSKVTSDKDRWLKGINAAVNIAGAAGDLGDLELMKYLKAAIEKIYIAPNKTPGVDFKKIIESCLNNPESWAKSVTTMKSVIAASGSLGDLDICLYVPELFKKVYDATL